MHPSTTLTLHRPSPGPPPRAKSTPTLWLTSLLSSCSSLSSNMDPPLQPPHQQSQRNKQEKRRIPTPALLASPQDMLSQCPVAMQPPPVYHSSHQLTPHPSSSDTSPWMRMVKWSLQQWGIKKKNFLNNDSLDNYVVEQIYTNVYFKISTTTETSLHIKAMIIIILLLFFSLERNSSSQAWRYKAMTRNCCLSFFYPVLSSFSCFS